MFEWLTAVSNAVTPIGGIIGFFGALAGFIVAFVRLRKQVIHGAENSKTAADQSTIAARESKDSSAQVNGALKALTDRLVETQEARTREADKNDRVLAALLNSMSDSRDLIRWIKQQELPSRVRELEEFAADRETEEHITGRLRLHEVAPLNPGQDPT